MQDSSGIRRVLTLGAVYNAAMNLIGANRARRWYAENVWHCTKTDKVVDIGCGTGSVLDFLPASVEYIGFDISENYIKKAKQRYGDRGLFLVGSVEGFLSKQETRLDNATLILSTGVLHHLSDSEAEDLLTLSKNIMAPKGRLVCTEPVFLRHQTYLSKWIISQDRGKGVRTEQAWKELIRRVFDSYQTHIVTGLLRIPYDHIIIECR